MKEKTKRKGLVALVGALFLGTIFSYGYSTHKNSEALKKQEQELKEEIWKTELKYSPYIMLDNYETVRNPEFPWDSTDSLAYFNYP